jgi:hypothetical protein
MMRVIRVCLIVCLFVLMVVPQALADGAEVAARGRAPMTTHWVLTLSLHRRIKVDFEVDTNRANHRWRIVMRHDGRVFFNEIRVTDGAGDFDIERRVRNRPGEDTIRVRAVDLKNGVTIVAMDSI